MSILHSLTGGRAAATIARAAPVAHSSTPLVLRGRAAVAAAAPSNGENVIAAAASGRQEWQPQWQWSEQLARAQTDP